MEPSKILVPVRYSAWLAGELGRRLHDALHRALDPVPGAQVTMMPRGFLVMADEAPGVLLEAVHRAIRDLEATVEHDYPVFHHEMGPMWTGTLQSVFATVEARRTAARGRQGRADERGVDAVRGPAPRLMA